LRHNAAQALTEVGTAAEVAPGQYFTSLAEPVGVVAIIVPWNTPVALFIRSLGPALAAGTRSWPSCPDRRRSPMR
jgi:acyl-CoA reductase-like NAD-dependent aldehyde dehydrogenase